MIRRYYYEDPSVDSEDSLSPRRPPTDKSTAAYQRRQAIINREFDLPKLKKTTPAFVEIVNLGRPDAMPFRRMYYLSESRPEDYDFQKEGKVLICMRETETDESTLPEEQDVINLIAQKDLSVADGEGHLIVNNYEAYNVVKVVETKLPTRAQPTFAANKIVVFKI